MGAINKLSQQEKERRLSLLADYYYQRVKT